MSTLDKIKGLSLVSTFDKSSLSPLVAYCDDLAGCKTNTHARFRQSGTLNERFNCAPPSPIFQFSFSGLQLLNVTPQVGTAYNELLTYMIQALNDPGNPFINPAQTGFIPAPYEFRGEVWKATDINKATVLLTIPQQEEVVDNCGNPVGTKIMSGISYSAPNAECKIEIVSQLSMTMLVNTPIARIADILSSAKVPAAIDLAATVDCGSPQTVTINHIASFTLPYLWAPVSP